MKPLHYFMRINKNTLSIRFCKIKYIYFISLLVIVFFVSSCHNRINSSDMLVNAMIEKYDGRWFKEISFEQTTSFYKEGEIFNTESWYETYQYPGKLLIEYDKFGSGSGQLYRNDSIYLFTNHKLDTAYPLVHSLVFLTMDLYHLDKKFAIKRISDMGFDISKFRTDKFNDVPVYVVGSSVSDDNLDQFWVDKEKLIVVKMIKNTNKGIQVVELDDYRELNGYGLIEQQVRFYLNDELYMTEKYYNIEIPENNIDTYFEPNFVLSKYIQLKHGLFNLPDFRISPFEKLLRLYGLLIFY
ncbi:MAG: hypothetical protein PHF99_02390 [Bacteroidales bacterium]|nr:hypothetical protein [Bacteroidales bacterium]